MKRAYLILVNFAYAIVTTSIYLLVLKENANSELAPVIVAISAVSLLSLAIRFGGNEYVLSMKNGLDFKSRNTFLYPPISFSLILWFLSAPVAIYFLVINNYNADAILALLALIIIQPLGSILETIYYIENKLNIIIKSKVYGTLWVVVLYLTCKKLSYSSSLLLVLFGFAPSIYLCYQALRDRLLVIRLVNYIDFRKLVSKNYKYAALSMIYILPLTFDKIYIANNPIYEKLVIYDFQFKFATLFEVIVLGPILGLFARNRAKHIKFHDVLWMSLIALSSILALVYAQGILIKVVSFLDRDISDSLDGNFILPMCFTYIFLNFITNIYKQKLIFIGLKDRLFRIYLYYAVGLVLSFIVLLPQSIYQVVLHLIIGSCCLLVWVFSSYQRNHLDK